MLILAYDVFLTGAEFVRRIIQMAIQESSW